MMLRFEEKRTERRTQPKTEEQERLVMRAQSLFRTFYDKEQARREKFKTFRKLRELEDDELANTTAPKLNVLNSMIDTVIADQMDNPLEALMIPERADELTMRSADNITDVVRFCLDQCAWDSQYRRMMEDSAVLGTAVAQVFWDEEGDGGEGLACAMRIKPENFFPDPAYENIQDGRGVFKATWTTVGWVQEHYPDYAEFIQGDEYANDGDGEALSDVQDADEGCMLLEFWYKRYDAKRKRENVHMALLCGDTLLYCSEEEADMEAGVYAHGEYPFVVFPYRERAGSTFGMGLMDDYAEQWRTVCRYMKYIDDNARRCSRKRYFVRRGADSVTQFADMERDFVEMDDVREESVRPIDETPLNNQVIAVMQYMIDNMKQDSGQTQFTRGEGGMGVTAASAIQALQEAGGKTARMHTATYKESFRQMVNQMIWVLSDYIDAERVMLVTGSSEMPDVMHAVKLSPPKRGKGGAIAKPPYTVRIQVQKKNPMQIQADNQYVLQIAQACGQAGQPLPPAAVVRLLRGQDNKAQVLQEIEAADTTREQMEQLAAQNEQLTETVKQLQKQGLLQKQVINKQHQALAAQRAPQQVNTPSYGMLNETVGVNRAEL